MKLQDAIGLIQHPAITQQPKPQWADLGCGDGLFTYALAGLLQKGGIIHAIDKLPVTLQRHPLPQHISIYTKQLDFVHHILPFNQLNGILMANSLHFVANKAHFITTVAKQLVTGGLFLVVEYDTDTANPWVPYPVGCASLQALFAKAGYPSFVQLQTILSLYHTGNIYAALIKTGQ